MQYSAWNAAEGIISVYRSVEDPTQLEQARNAVIPIEQATAKVMLFYGETETM